MPACKFAGVDCAPPGEAFVLSKRSLQAQAVLLHLMRKPPKMRPCRFRCCGWQMNVFCGATVMRCESLASVMTFTARSNKPAVST